MDKFERFFDRAGDIVGYVCMFVMALMIVDVFFTSWQDTFSLTVTSHFKSFEWHFLP